MNQSRRKFEANPQGVGYDQMEGLIAYCDRILGGYGEDVTGELSTLTGTFHMLSIQAPRPKELGAEIVKDSTLAGHEWRGPAYSTFQSTVTGKTNVMGEARSCRRQVPRCGRSVGTS